ncbi:MAG: O-antigen ligase family protein [Candidatus Krumholzibacteriia bacterium]
MVDRALFACLALTALTATVSVAAGQIALGLTLLLALWLLARRRGGPLRTGLEWPAALFVGWALLMIPWSGDRAQSLLFARRFWLLAAVWLFAAHGAAGRRRACLAGAFLAGAVIAALYGLRGAGRAVDLTIAHRLTLAQGYMTGAGLMMSAALTALAFVVAWPRGRARLWSAAALAPLLLALVLTMTRGAWLGFLAGAVVLLALRRARWLVPLAVVVAALVALAPASARDRFLSSFDPRHERNTQRETMWRTGWRMMLDHPLTGVGDHDLKRLYAQYHAGEPVEIQGHLHSNLVQFGAIWGVPGLLLGGAFLVSMPVLLWRRRRAWRALGAAAPPGAEAWVLAALAVWTGFNVMGLFEWTFGDAEVALALFIVVGMGLSRAGRRE